MYQFNNKRSTLIIVAVLAVVIIGVLLFAGNKSNSFDVLSLLHLRMSKEQVAQKSVDYLNKSVLQQGQTATLGDVTEESGVVKMKIKIGTNSYDSYATLDGRLLFPEAFTLTPVTASPTPVAQNTTTTITPANVTKVSKTSLDAYVVSSCPYGIQVQRALSDAIKTVPALAQYVTVRYIGGVSGNTITSMHGNEEAQENLKQICIRDEQPAKYWDYVSCYIKKATGTASNGMPFGDSTTCQTTASVDVAKLNACVSDPARGLADAKADFALDSKYNVSGSPTLILNGSTISEDAFGGRSSDAMRNIICSSSKVVPSFCSAKLNTVPATTSFSLSYAGSGSGAAANTNCAPTAN